jgi:hypothetical protein
MGVIISATDTRTKDITASDRTWGGPPNRRSVTGQRKQSLPVTLGGP